MYLFSLVQIALVVRQAQRFLRGVASTLSTFWEPQISSFRLYDRNNDYVDVTALAKRWFDESFVLHKLDFGLAGLGKRMELRYVYRGRKYRMVDSDRIYFPVHLLKRPGPSLESAIDVVTGEDYTDRFRKYYGPNNNFHESKERNLDWFFPGDCPDEENEREICLSFSDGKSVVIRDVRQT